MLYTTYISNMKNLPEGKYILVTRWCPKSLDLSKFDDAVWEPILSPSDNLLASYKNATMTKVDMLNKYKEYLSSSLAVREAILKIAEKAKQEDVFLICYEKEAFECHRSILAQYISEKYNIPWQEFKK